MCKSCDSTYRFEECLKTSGTNTTIVSCYTKIFKKRCDQTLMNQVISSRVSFKYYPYKVYCYVSLISSLQILLMQNGCVDQCESTKNQFSASSFSDVYDGTLGNDF